MRITLGIFVLFVLPVLLAYFLVEYFDGPGKIDDFYVDKEEKKDGK